MAARESEATHLRFNINERLQHGLLMLATILLMLTGLSLRFADTGFGRAVIDFSGGMEARGLLHRAAAVVTIVLCFHHMLYVVFTERGHQQLMAMKLGLQDARDLVQAVRYNLGRSEEAPQFGRYDYRQKAQYWAVALAMNTMVITGFSLWFESVTMAVMPKWAIDLAQTVHSGEGLLIFVALFVWHLYDSHLRSGVLRMEASWLTGKVAREELRRRHRREYDALYGTDDAER